MSDEAKDPEPEKMTFEGELKAGSLHISSGPTPPAGAAVGDIFLSSDGVARIKTGTAPGEVKTIASGGIVSSSGSGSLSGTSWVTAPPPTSVGGITYPTATPKKPKPSKTLAGPTKQPRKLLVAFLNDDDEVEWCAKVHPQDLRIDFDAGSIAPQMALSFYLIEAD